jgi:CHAT domain
MTYRDDLLAALRARLNRVATEGSPSPVLQPEAVSEARELTGLLQDDDGDLEARLALGWLYWNRYQARQDDPDNRDLADATAMFTWCFINGVPGFPGTISVALAEQAIPAATEMLENVLASPNEARISAALDIWRRILDTLPADHQERAECLSKLGVALLLRSQHSEELADIEAAIEAGRAAAELTLGDSPLRAACLSNLGVALKAKAERTGVLPDIDAAIETARSAAESTPPRDLNRPRYLFNLGAALYHRGQLTGTLTDLDAAIEALQASLQSAPPDYRDRASYLAELSIALHDRSERTAGSADLDAAIEAARVAVQSTPADAPVQLRFLPTLANSLRARFERFGKVSDINAAIEAAAAAAEAAPVSHPYRPVALRNLWLLLEDRFRHTGATADLDEAIDAGRATMSAIPVDAPDRSKLLCELALSLRAKFQRSGSLEDLDAAISAQQQAIKATPTDDPDRAARLSDLGVFLDARFEHTGILEDGETAVQAATAAVDASRPGNSNRALYLSNLGIVLLNRFFRIGEPEDLARAVKASESAVETASSDHPNRGQYLSNLGLVLLTYFRHQAANGALDAAIEAAQAATQITPIGHPNRGSYLSNLAAALQIRYERSRSLDDLSAAIQAEYAAVEASPLDIPGVAEPMSALRAKLLENSSQTASGYSAVRQRATGQAHTDRLALARRLSNLGIGLRDRYEQTCVPTDLDAAIEAGRAAVEAIPASHPERAKILENLGISLQIRFERTGALADADAAVTAGFAALEATPADHPDRATRLNNIAIALGVRAVRTRDPADVDASVESAKAALEKTPVGHPDRAQRLSILGNALELRYQQNKMAADQDDAIKMLQAAVDSETQDLGKVMYLSNLCDGLRQRFERTGAVADLDEAIRSGQSAAAGVRPDGSDLAVMSFNLGLALRARFELQGESADSVAASSAFVAAAEATPAAPSIRIHAARAASQLMARQEVGQAADILENAVRLLSEVAPRQLARADQQHAIGGFSGLASEAAALVLSDTRPGTTREQRAARALQLLEAGRAVLLSQTLDTRDDLTDLRQEYPYLAERFIVLRDRLDQPESSASVGSGDTATVALSLDSAAEKRRQLADQLTATLNEIRTMKNFHSFGLPPSIEALTNQAVPGPIVTVNVSDHRSDALLLRGESVTSVELTSLTRTALVEQINTFHQALDISTEHEVASSARREAQRTIMGILGWLWDVVAGPVLDHLGYERSLPSDASWPRVWWAPGGLLGLLPIHAAGHHAELAVEGKARRTVMDRVVSSYTPTIRALIYARQGVGHVRTLKRGLIVAMPTTPKLPDGAALPNVPAEVAAVSAYLPNPVILIERTPSDSAAEDSDVLPTRAKIFEFLPECSIAHFACHAASHPSDPSNSLLLLHDYDTAPLTVNSLAPIQHDGLELVYLSACRTAFTRTSNLLDEAIHLTSAFQLAGSRHVIGTLWEISDAIAVHIAGEFYRELRTSSGTLDTDRAAYALHLAIRNARDVHLQTPSLWAAHVHAGA